VQSAGFAEGAAGFAGVADERGDRIAAREYATDDLAARRGRWRRSLRCSSCLLPVKPEQFEDVRSTMMARAWPAGLGASGRFTVAGAVLPEAASRQLAGLPASGGTASELTHAE